MVELDRKKPKPWPASPVLIKENEVGRRRDKGMIIEYGDGGLPYLGVGR